MGNEVIDTIAEIRARVADRDDSNAMASACGEYNCGCHAAVPVLLDAYDATVKFSERQSADYSQLLTEHDELRARLVEVEGKLDTVKVAEIHSAQRCLAAESQIVSARGNVINEAIAAVDAYADSIGNPSANIISTLEALRGEGE